MYCGKKESSTYVSSRATNLVLQTRSMLCSVIIVFKTQVQSILYCTILCLGTSQREHVEDQIADKARNESAQAGSLKVHVVVVSK